MAAVSVSIHGSSFQVEDMSRVDRAIHHGWGLEVGSYRHGGYDGPAAWVHAPVPIAAAWQLELAGSPRPPYRPSLVEIEERVSLTRIGINLVTPDDSDLPAIVGVDVWNGGAANYPIVDLHERGPLFGWDFDPALEIDGSLGLNLAIGLEFSLDIDSPPPLPPAPAIFLQSALAFFTVASR